MEAGPTVIELRNDLAELGRLASELAAFGCQHTIPSRLLLDVNLALEEIVTNIISYAYDDDRDHVIRIELVADGQVLMVRIEDDGRPFDPTQAAEPDLEAPLEERQVGGLGMRLVRKMMGDVRYAREHDRNVLSVTRRTRGTQEDGASSRRPARES